MINSNIFGWTDIGRFGRSDRLGRFERSTRTSTYAQFILRISGLAIGTFIFTSLVILVIINQFFTIRAS